MISRRNPYTVGTWTAAGPPYRLAAVPQGLSAYDLALANDGGDLVYTFDAQAEHTGIAELLRELSKRGVDFKDLQTEQSSLEEIFVSLVRGQRTGAAA